MPEEVTRNAVDALRAAISTIRGWDSVLGHAIAGMGPTLHLGRMISSIILAAGEDYEPVAVTGEIDEAENGYLAVAYEQFLVVADVLQVTDRAGKYTVRLLGWGGIESAEVTTRHSSFGDQERLPHETLGLQLTVDGRRLDFKVRDGESPLVQGEAIHALLDNIRKQLSNR